MAFSADVLKEIEAVATANGIEPAALKAIVEVESGGRATSKVDGKDMPLILYEYHIFYRYKGLTAEQRSKAVSKRLASKNWKEIPYIKSQSGRYAQLARAAAINEQAAYSACSWGVGQVMGMNAEWLGYKNPKALADTCIKSVGGQVEVMLAYIRKAKLLDEIENRDWRGFARGYNGGGQVELYGSRIASAYKRHAGGNWQPTHIAPGVLKFGAKGDAVLVLQRQLRAQGYHLHIDGDFGPATRKMVIDFQTAQGLTADGIAGPATLGALDALGGRS